MTDTYCKVVNGVIVGRQLKDNPRSKVGPDGFPIWRILIKRGDAPTYNPSTHHAPVPIETIQGTRVVESWEDPVAKTQEEIDAELEASKEGQLSKLDVANSADKALAKAIFILLNDVRALKGQQPVTAQQFRTWLKAQM